MREAGAGRVALRSGRVAHTQAGENVGRVDASGKFERQAVACFWVRIWLLRSAVLDGLGGVLGSKTKKGGSHRQRRWYGEAVADLLNP